jgi:hypothetical protein
MRVPGVLKDPGQLEWRGHGGWGQGTGGLCLSSSVSQIQAQTTLLAPSPHASLSGS